MAILDIATEAVGNHPVLPAPLDIIAVEVLDLSRQPVVTVSEKPVGDPVPGLRMSHSSRALAHAVTTATADLAHQLDRIPTTMELAAHLGVDSRDLLTAIGAAQAYHLTHLNTLAGGVGVAGHTGQLTSIVATFAARSQRMLTLRFTDHVPPTVFPDEVDMSQVRVSRLLKRSLALLRADLPT